ncbi:hypothetical protein FHR83_008097 [Actinoplanes campanulatus]|uniref:Uncharacterized protein n=1 Tax=Actinoplanes campanulatus TaxID=113559 RepID=A0A7W5FJC9_9ACTN|nr:hypothetical protein [Actinoplanes campanulatus]MBB3100375.1 hypothetical protein [Actinoplanes campanulatus]GGN24484.1 hypothetical protein GCM10010109_40020 [Actinoplanes campanulatus]GID39586.1 hypothetical protein Aca09nite_60920 [Actinoplanes campanulatus]
MQLLAVPFPAFDATCSVNLQHAGGCESWELPEDLDEAGPVMDKVYQRIVDVATPFFAEHGTMAGFTSFMQKEVRNSPANLRFHEKLFYAHLLNDDVPAALNTAETIAAYITGRDDPSPWVLELSDHAARATAAVASDRELVLRAIRENVEHTRTKLRLRDDR